jgi:hypothetical protein
MHSNSRPSPLMQTSVLEDGSEEGGALQALAVSTTRGRIHENLDVAVRQRSCE